MRKNKISSGFYLLSGTIGVIIYLSYHLFYSSLFLNLHPYFIILFFICYSLVVYQKTRSLDVRKYLPVLPVYMLMFSAILLYEYFIRKHSQFWAFELVIQLSVTGTSLLIGYGLAYIFFRIKEIKQQK